MKTFPEVVGGARKLGDPFLAMRREMENVFRAFDQKPSYYRHWGWRTGNQCGGNKRFL